MLTDTEMALASKRAEELFMEVEAAGVGKIRTYESCNCGSHIRHNNGGNYHDLNFYRFEFGKWYARYDTTCELEPKAEYEPSSASGVLEDLRRDLQNDFWFTVEIPDPQEAQRLQATLARRNRQIRDLRRELRRKS